MLKDLSGGKEINSFFEELNTMQNKPLILGRIYGMAYESQEINKAKNEIEKVVKTSNYIYVKEVTIVSDEIAIAQVENKRMKDVRDIPVVHFVPVVHGHAKRIGKTFDEALVIALCEKYNYGNFDVAIANMLEMNKGKEQ